MSRPRSDEKRKAILDAATRVIVTQGLSAPTAGIAKEAGVANGSLFTYFETKAELFNQLYLELKADMANAALTDLRPGVDPRQQLFQVWQRWMAWAMACPDKRRALAQLDVYGEITPETRAAGHRTMAAIADLLEDIRTHGSMRKVPMGFVVALLNSIAEATILAMAQDPAHARKRSNEGFDALWRAVA
ncbi:TetR/AcrR family transcriptional regulator [Terriglobus sp.]|uniref:TetR/AcrR family transcriptional regulator n=1 Tax=Terriglobus sp. TaxID=1889013 RepID=UPI003AFF8EF1